MFVEDLLQGLSLLGIRPDPADEPSGKKLNRSESFRADLSSFPMEILLSLCPEKLRLYQNMSPSIPEGISAVLKLGAFGVSGNQLTIFPEEILYLRIKLPASGGSPCVKRIKLYMYLSILPFSFCKMVEVLAERINSH